MNSMRNRVQLIGHLGRDPECLEIGDRKLVKFSLATDQKFKNAEGEWETITTWHHVVAWGKIASQMEKVLTKGSEIMLEGKIVNRSYEDKNGQKRYVSEIEVRDFMLIGYSRA